jgi:hypothetical protein
MTPNNFPRIIEKIRGMVFYGDSHWEESDLTPVAADSPERAAASDMGMTPASG